MTDERQLPRDSAPAHEEAFAQVLAHRTMLKTYILALVHDPHLAEDTLSDTTLAIARSWRKYDPSLAFGPWARGIARRVAFVNLRKAGRARVGLDDDVLESLEAELDAIGDEIVQERLRQQLNSCLDQLPERSRELVRLRYFENIAYPEMARRTGRSPAALYMAFTRIHDALAECVKNASGG